MSQYAAKIHHYRKRLQDRFKIKLTRLILNSILFQCEENEGIILPDRKIPGNFTKVILTKIENKEFITIYNLTDKFPVTCLETNMRPRWYHELVAKKQTSMGAIKCCM